MPVASGLRCSMACKPNVSSFGVPELDERLDQDVESWLSVPFLTWRTEGSTGRPRCSPVRPGITPPTILVPHAKESLAFAVA